MSDILNESLIVAAMKDGASNALEELKERLIFGQYSIRAIISRIPCSDADRKMLEQHILEIILDDLHREGFSGPILQDGFRYATYFASLYKKNNEIKLSDLNQTKEKAVQINPLTLDDLHRKRKYPPLEEIDLEIQTLVSLLNQFPYIRTSGSSCSGHPTRENWKPYGGYIGITHFGNGTPRTTLNFLIDLLMLLDNSDASVNNPYLPTSLQIAHGTQNANTTSDDTICELYKQADAETLYHSGVPIVLINVNFRFYVCHSDAKHSLEIWKQLIACVKELIPENKELTTEVSTPEMAMQLLQKVLHQLPFLFSATLITSQEGYPGIILNTVADLALCQWFSALADILHERLTKAGYVSSPDADGEMPFTMNWSFRLRPFLSQEIIPLPHLSTPQWEPRTCEDHLKIWTVLENAVEKQLKKEAFNTTPSNNQTD